MFNSLKLCEKKHNLSVRPRFMDYLNFLTSGDLIIYICFSCSIRILHVYN